MGSQNDPCSHHFPLRGFARADQLAQLGDLIVKELYQILRLWTTHVFLSRPKYTQILIYSERIYAILYLVLFYFFGMRGKNYTLDDQLMHANVTILRHYMAQTD